MSTVALLGTLDTKSEEIGFAAQVLREAGVGTMLIDISTGERDAAGADVTACQVMSAAGREPDDRWRASDRRERQDTMVAGATAVVGELLEHGRLDGVMGLGGSNNTSMAAAVFRSLPIGLPKLILTTMAGDGVGEYVGAVDLIIAPSVVDLAGLNRLTRTVIHNAAAALAGMVDHPHGADGAPTAPVIACSMVGLTSTAVGAARELLEARGYEVVVFHMTGRGGRAMESFIAGGSVVGVLDLTTSELADELYGGVCSAGPGRLRTAARLGVPQVVAPGGLDMINFGTPDTVPTPLRGRRRHAHNAEVTLVRTSPRECAELGRELISRLAATAANDASPGSVVVVPADGLSAIDRAGAPFHDPAATAALREAVHAAAANLLTVADVPGSLDDPAFGRAAAERLLELIEAGQTSAARPLFTASSRP